MTVNILIVDEQQAFREFLKRILETDQMLKVGAEAVDGEQAVSLVGQVKPDVVMMNIDMLRSNGLEATRKIKARSSQTKVILMSSLILKSRKECTGMRKLLCLVVALLVTSVAGWATPCSPTLNLGGLISLGASGCTLFTGSVVGSASSNLPAQGTIDITAVASGSGAGGFTAGPISLSGLAGSSSTFNFTLTPAAGVSINDLNSSLTGGTGGTLALTLSNGATIGAATTGGATEHTTFSGVSSLTVSGTLSASAGASGSTTIAITPSFTPEPASFFMFGTGLLGLAWLVRRKLRTV